MAHFPDQFTAQRAHPAHVSEYLVAHCVLGSGDEDQRAAGHRRSKTGSGWWEASSHRFTPEGLSFRRKHSYKNLPRKFFHWKDNAVFLSTRQGNH
jgi:hypothetical protein